MCSSSKGCVWWWIAALSVLVEILVFTAAQDVNVQPGHERNVALGRPCNQSSVWWNIYGVCGGAINGRKEAYTSSSTTTNCIHTGGSDPRPWWTVYLEPNIYIHKINIFSRPEHKIRMANVSIYLDKTFFHKIKCKDDNTCPKDHSFTFNTTQVQKAQSVTLTNEEEPPECLNICEVEVFACIKNRFGLNCDKNCSSDCKLSNVTCDRLNGACIECKNNTVWGEYCDKPCPEGCKRRDVTCNKSTGACIECQNNAVWGDKCDKPCPEGCKPGNVACDINTGFCIECIDGKWGDNCADACGAGCDETNCHLNGTCTCRSHWMPPKCDACKNNHFGLNCDKNCSSDCKLSNVTCDRLNGACLECKNNTVWGEYCDKPCPEGCKRRDVTCNKSTGACIECPDEKWGDNCTDACGAGCDETNCHLNGTCTCRSHWMPPKCDVCNPGKWGPDCLNDCGEGCKDGKCDKANGHCKCKTEELIAPLCGGCNPGKWGKDCENDCGAGCEGETCNKDDGACNCLPGWGESGTQCDGRPCECGEECTTSRKYIFADVSRKVNVAIGKPSKASTIQKVDNDDSAVRSCLANDGYLSTSELTTCMSTAEGDPAPFWELDLEEKYEIAGINIDFDEMGLKSGISILLDGKEIFVTNDQTDPVYIPNNKRRNLIGQVLRLQRKGLRRDPLKICEVEVFNCMPGFYGYECEGICEQPVCDNGKFCSRIDGSCPKTVEVKETTDCSPLILVAGYVVGFLIISLFIFAAKVIPYKNKPKRKAVKKEAESDKVEGKSEGDKEEGGSGSGGDKEEESETESGEKSETGEKESQV